MASSKPREDNSRRVSASSSQLAVDRGVLSFEVDWEGECSVRLTLEAIRLKEACSDNAY